MHPGISWKVLISKRIRKKVKKPDLDIWYKKLQIVMLILYLRKMFCFENIFVTIIVRLLNKGTEKMCRMRMWTLVYVFLEKKISGIYKN